jgi:hypothetical protein
MSLVASNVIKINMKMIFSLVFLSLMLSMIEGQGGRRRPRKPPTMPPTGMPTTKPTESLTSPPDNSFIVKLLESVLDPDAACNELAKLIGGEVGYVLKGLFTGCEIIPSMVSTMSVTEMSELLSAANGVESVTENGPIEGYD